MIYLVSGHPRTGSSAVVESLIKGGMEAMWDDKEHQHVLKTVQKDGYQPHPAGTYEWFSWDKKPMIKNSAEELEEWRALFQNKLCKIFHRSLFVLPKDRYKIVYLTRRYEEIEQSTRKVYDKGWEKRLIIAHNREEYAAMVRKAIDFMRSREDIEFSLISYNVLLQDPIAVFEALKTSGWPIDPKQAASVIDPKWYRMRS